MEGVVKDVININGLNEDGGVKVAGLQTESWMEWSIFTNVVFCVMTGNTLCHSESVWWLRVKVWDLAKCTEYLEL